MDNSTRSTSYRIFWILLVILLLFCLSYLNSQDGVELSEISESTTSQPREVPPPTWHRPYHASVLPVPPVTEPEDESPVVPPDVHGEEIQPVAYVDESNDQNIGGEILRTDDEPEIPGTPPPPPPCQFQEC